MQNLILDSDVAPELHLYFSVRLDKITNTCSVRLQGFPTCRHKYLPTFAVATGFEMPAFYEFPQWVTNSFSASKNHAALTSVLHIYIHPNLALSGPSPSSATALYTCTLRALVHSFRLPIHNDFPLGASASEAPVYANGCIIDPEDHCPILELLWEYEHVPIQKYVENPIRLQHLKPPTMSSNMHKNPDQVCVKGSSISHGEILTPKHFVYKSL